MAHSVEVTLKLICTILDFDLVELWTYKNKEYLCRGLSFSDSLKHDVQDQTGLLLGLSLHESLHLRNDSISVSS